MKLPMNNNKGNDSNEAFKSLLFTKFDSDIKEEKLSEIF